MFFTPDDVRTVIRGCTSDGETLDAIERELIEPALLSDDQKSGLWLTWSSMELGRARPQRRRIAER